MHRRATLTIATVAVLSCRAPLRLPLATPVWVEFDAPMDPIGVPMHGGPAWAFRTPGLPARRRGSAQFVLPYQTEAGLGTVPNLSLHFVSPAFRSALTTQREIEILRDGEFRAPIERLQGTPGADNERTALFAKLASDVRDRIASAERELNAIADLDPLEACTIVSLAPASSVGDPFGCAADQEVTCRGVRVTFRAGRQEIVTARGTTKFPEWKKASVSPGSELPPAEVNECVHAAWIETSLRWLVFEQAYRCQTAGDWCSVPSEWRILDLESM